MTFEEKWDYFNRYAKFDLREKWVQIALSFIKNNASAGRVDFSFKNINNDIYFSRLNIGPITHHQKSYYEQWYQDILEIGKCLKITWPDKKVQSFFKALDWSICDSFHCGLDLRTKMEDSRLKVWCGFRSDKKTIQELVKHYPFDKNILTPYWEKYNSGLILLGWVYNGDGKVSWRIYPEIPSKHFVLESKNHVVRKLGPLSEKVISTWPTTQPLIYWDKINDKNQFLKELAPLLCSNQTIPLINDFQEHGLSLSIVSTVLPATKNDKITESNFYFI